VARHVDVGGGHGFTAEQRFMFASAGWCAGEQSWSVLWRAAGAACLTHNGAPRCVLVWHLVGTGSRRRCPPALSALRACACGWFLGKRRCLRNRRNDDDKYRPLQRGMHGNTAPLGSHRSPTFCTLGCVLTRRFRTSRVELSCTPTSQSLSGSTAAPRGTNCGLQDSETDMDFPWTPALLRSSAPDGTLRFTLAVADEETQPEGLLQQQCK
jgi:hypothetical protein